MTEKNQEETFVDTPKKRKTRKRFGMRPNAIIKKQEAIERRKSWREWYGELYFIIQKFKNEKGAIPVESRDLIIDEIHSLYPDIDEEFATSLVRRVTGMMLANGDLVAEQALVGTWWENNLWGIDESRKERKFQDHRNYLVDLKASIPSMQKEKGTNFFGGILQSPSGTQGVVYQGTADEVSSAVEKTVNAMKNSAIKTDKLAIEEKRKEFGKTTIDIKEEEVKSEPVKLKKEKKHD